MRTFSIISMEALEKAVLGSTSFDRFLPSLTSSMWHTTYHPLLHTPNAKDRMHVQSMLQALYVHASCKPCSPMVRCIVRVCGACIAWAFKGDRHYQSCISSCYHYPGQDQEHIPVCTHAACKHNPSPLAEWPTTYYFIQPSGPLQHVTGHKAPTTIIEFWPSGPQLYKNKNGHWKLAHILCAVEITYPPYCWRKGGAGSKRFLKIPTRGFWGRPKGPQEL